MRRVAAVAALVTGALVAAPAASGLIVVQQGIRSVELEMTRAQVRAKLGAPVKVNRGTNEFGPWVEFVYSGLRVNFQGGRTVTAVSTAAHSQRTAGGVGPGSTEARVRARIRGVRCRTEFGSRHCWVGRFLPGRRVTDFFIRNGRVTRVTVGFVID